MATCIIEDSISLLRYCPTLDTIKQINASSLETMNQRCQSSFYINSIQIDSKKLVENHELNKKRPFHRSNTYNDKDQSNRLVIDNSCSMQAASTNINHETSTILTRPTTLLITDTSINCSIPRLRACLSHPSTSSNSSLPIDDIEFSPTKFTSLPILLYPPNKRLRSETLTLAPKHISIPVLSETVSTSLQSIASSFHFIDSFELADKLKENVQIIIFDCGSPFRHSENRICNSHLLRVSDKISRKRLKTNSIKHLNIDIKQLNESDLIILYDDHSDNHHELSAGLKCAYEEFQRLLTIKHPPIFILKNSFNHFFNLYPDLCELHQSSSSKDDSSFSPIPISSNLDFPSYPMTHIIDGLFIGSESNAKNLEELSSEHIKHIVNVTSHVPAYHSHRFQYYHILADDTQKQNLLDHFDEAYNYIYKAIQNNEKILVHCVAGISRSPAIVISFLMRYAKMTMNDAYEFVRKKRSIVSPNFNFMGQLLQYEKILREQKISI